MVLADERCCGHDFYWGGDKETFRNLAVLNKDQIERLGVERVVFTCPECLSTFKQLYARVGVEIQAELLSISQLIAQNVSDLELDERVRSVTFQDPCRLARHLGDTESPREALSAIPGVTIDEMAHSDIASICCAGSWNCCDAVTKTIQVNRLDEAKRTGSELLVTACPKCEVHLKCTAKGMEEVDFEIKDLAGFVAEALSRKSETVSLSSKGGKR
jgi:Fe-S oxidoreductase